MLKNPFKIVLFLTVFATSLESFAVKSFYVLTVNFSQGLCQVDTALTGDKGICTGDTLYISAVSNVVPNQFSSSVSSQFIWKASIYGNPPDINNPIKTVTMMGTALVIYGNLPASSFLMQIKVDSVDKSVDSGVTIFDKFKTSPELELGNDITSCPGIVVTIQNQFSPTAIYNWNYNGFTTSGINVNTPGIYSVTVSSTQFGNRVCISTDNIKLSYFTKPELANQGTVYRCFNESLQLNATFSTPSTEPYIWNWNPTLNLSNPNIQNPVLAINGAQQTDFTVYVTDANSCKDTTTITVEKNPEFKIKINQEDVTLCKFVPIPLPVSIVAPGAASTASDYKYIWSTTTGLSNTTISSPLVQAVLSAGISYVVTVTDLHLCTAKDTVTIKKSSLEMNFVSPSAEVVTICAGNVISGLQISRKGGNGPFAFNWQPSDLLVKVTDSLYNSKAITQNQKIIVTVSGGGCIDKDSINVVLKPGPTTQISSKDINICVASDKKVDLLQASESVNYTVRWSPAVRINDISSYQPTFTGDASESASPQIYIYTITSILNGCKFVDSLRLSTKAPTAVQIDNSFQDKVFVNKAATFKATPDGLQYSWMVTSVGGISQMSLPINNKQSISIEFPFVGPYNLSLTGTNPFGCQSTAINNIDVKNASVNVLYVPTIFSPAAQLEDNKTLKVFFTDNSVYPQSFKITVFSQTGQKVFESTDLFKMKADGWDGEGYPSGVYTWVVQCKFTDDTEYKHANSVMLLR